MQIGSCSGDGLVSRPLVISYPSRAIGDGLRPFYPAQGGNGSSEVPIMQVLRFPCVSWEPRGSPIVDKADGSADGWEKKAERPGSLASSRPRAGGVLINSSGRWAATEIWI